MKSDYKDLYRTYSLGFPYPKIEVCEKNLNYANLIQPNYAGIVSELTSVAQYTYQQFITSDYIKSTLKGIAMVEMHHLEILGELIIALGGNPNFCINKKSKPLYWNSKFIKEYNSVGELLMRNIDSEKKAIDQYRKTANLIEDENIIAILNRIILDEEYHVKLLTSLYEKEMNK